MLVICKSNLDVIDVNSIEVGKTYFVDKIECVDNQIYYKLKGFGDTMFWYFNFDMVSELRNDKLEELGI
jgi:hypothetical protein